MNDILLEVLRCPLCGAPFVVEREGRSFICLGNEKRHCYDISSLGHVNFAPPAQSHSGDAKEAVRSRTDFLDKGFYAPVRDAMLDIVKKSGKGLFVDAGCGEGYYSDAVAEYADIIGFDLSKSAVQAAAKRALRNQHKNALFAVSGIYDMPIAPESIDGVISIFAPCANEEFQRILKKDGILVVLGAGKNHLLGLKKAIYKDTYVNTERVDMPTDMTLLEEKQISYSITLSHSADIMNLFAMTPYYYRTGETDMQKLSQLESLTTEVDVSVRVYYKS